MRKRQLSSNVTSVEDGFLGAVWFHECVICFPCDEDEKIFSIFLHFRAFSGVGSGEATGEDGDTGHVALDYEATSRGPNTMFVMCHV